MKRFSEFLEFVKRQRDHEGNTLAVSRLLTDGGGEYGGKADANHADAETAKVLNEFSKVCSLNAIQHTFTSAHTPALNGLAERFNRTASEDARALLRDMSVSPKLWSYAVQYTVWLRNRIPHSGLGGLTPHHLLHHKPPRLGMARVFGSTCWAYDHSHEGFPAMKSTRGIFLGVAENRKAWLWLDTKTMKVRASIHCSFDESPETRRCTLRNFDLRQKKAGPAASKSEEAAALRERSLYSVDDFRLYDEPGDQVTTPGSSPAHPPCSSSEGGGSFESCG